MSGRFLTNYYHFDSEHFDQNRKERIYIYKITSVPPIRADASTTWNRVIKSISRKLER